MVLVLIEGTCVTHDKVHMDKAPNIQLPAKTKKEDVVLTHGKSGIEQTLLPSSKDR